MTNAFNIWTLYDFGVKDKIGDKMFKLNYKKCLAAFLLFVVVSLDINAAVLASSSNANKSPDYVSEFLGEDKFETFNRKVFAFNSKLNKFALRPMHILWASVMPKYGMDRIQGVYENVLYPRRLVSTLVQGDFKAAGSETLRFLTNSTLGLGGMFDPAKKYLKMEAVDADMEQALAKHNVKQGPYMVCPILSSSSPRAMVGKLLDAALDPSSYFGLPILSLVKLGFTINRTSYWQPLTILVESNYADPYDIARKFYGVDSYLKNTKIQTSVSGEVIGAGLPLESVREEYLYNEDEVEFDCLNDEWGESSLTDELAYHSIPEPPLEYGYWEDVALAQSPNPQAVSENTECITSKPQVDIALSDFNSQGPVVDAIRTAFFDLPGIDNSIWSELSIWNRSFSKRIKTDEVKITDGRKPYKFRYILQKDKNAPVVIIYPSVGEGYMSHHSVVLAKLFYEKGYSAIIQGSHFQWEFVNSMPEGYAPGLPKRDAVQLQNVSAKIVDYLQNKYDCKFNGKVVVGTSFGAMMSLFLADREHLVPILGVNKYIAVNPPIELVYAMRQFDKNSEEWKKGGSDIKEKAALVASKIMKLLNSEELQNEKKEDLPFSEDEAKLITGFVMHQKLSDLVFAMEKGKISKNCSELYSMINKMNFNDYVNKYMLTEEFNSLDSLNNEASLHSIKEFLLENDNYRIYHSIDDYLVNSAQLMQLKEYCRNNLTLMSNGSHLGFLYRKEFIESLKEQIPSTEKLKEEKI